MTSHLDAMDAVLAADHPSLPAQPPTRILAALGPRMMTLAADRADGAHTYLAPVEHTAWARQLLGPAKTLVVCVRAVIDAESALGRWAERARRDRSATRRTGATCDASASSTISPNRSVTGWVDALVACGDVHTVVQRVAEHLAAGAHHVCVEVLTGDDVSVPIEAWRDLAPGLLAL